jgi:four helix bundle protein
MKAVSDYKNLPLWKRGMSLAHAVYATVEEAGLKESEAGRRLRKAAVSVPSLVGEAFLDLSGREVDEALTLAYSKLAEVARLLTDEPALLPIPQPDRTALLADVQALRLELLGIEAGRSPSPQN